MEIRNTNINDCFVIVPKKNYDTRGSFHRSYCENILKKKKINFKLRQCNISINLKKGTMRGFHYQSKPYTENKIISAISGSIFNVIIDLRKESKTFLKKFIYKLKAEKNELLLVPAGCANAFLTTSNNTIIHYYMSSIFEKENKNKYKGFKFNDIYFDIKWPIKVEKISKKDKSYKIFNLKDLK
jgi:dTDP-4-dehydrorhamnose 3,5-epimerase